MALILAGLLVLIIVSLCLCRSCVLVGVLPSRDPELKLFGQCRSLHHFDSCRSMSHFSIGYCIDLCATLILSTVSVDVLLSCDPELELFG